MAFPQQGNLDSLNIYLDPQNSKHDEKSTADEDDISDGSERRDQSLHHQF